ncbi:MULTISPECIES: hypothetical protein [Streptococcus]|uniref:hypothetical protein n=1 Tax=Streptococcus TaxID=1301 RepID=UPI00055E3A68|nr:hypothetical protein [Streptococcus parauberis]AUT06836.1 hypothetical protein SPSF3K_02144 [Streptococcus parauberis]KYP18976.1 hypothetical protein AKL13_01548 [Streptococcus parauberis]KYP19410.1 hypothetical protein AKL14_00833 [Streptococcus parauberis]KYP22679.1 hypothetical protein TN39_00065 [Streptococcus parauberis]KYP23820.1 hypothetical protein TP84_02000 [Streptococcus parauberis]
MNKDRLLEQIQWYFLSVSIFLGGILIHAYYYHELPLVNYILFLMMTVLYFLADRIKSIKQFLGWLIMIFIMDYFVWELLRGTFFEIRLNLLILLSLFAICLLLFLIILWIRKSHKESK